MLCSQVLPSAQWMCDQEERTDWTAGEQDGPWTRQVNLHVFLSNNLCNIYTFDFKYILRIVSSSQGNVIECTGIWYKIRNFTEKCNDFNYCNSLLHLPPFDMNTLNVWLIVLFINVSGQKMTVCKSKRPAEGRYMILFFRSVSAIIGWIRFILATEQKKTDFKNDAEDAPLSMLSPVRLIYWYILYEKNYMFLSLLLKRSYCLDW